MDGTPRTWLDSFEDPAPQRRPSGPPADVFELDYDRELRALEAEGAFDREAEPEELRSSDEGHGSSRDGSGVSPGPCPCA